LQQLIDSATTERVFVLPVFLRLPSKYRGNIAKIESVGIFVALAHSVLHYESTLVVSVGPHFHQR
jgi:hypothetical protein